MKKFKSFLILFLVLSIVFIPMVNAEEAQTGTISGNYSFDDTKLDNIEVAAYLIADVDMTNGFNYQFKSDFKDHEMDVNSLNYGELEQYVLELEKTIKDTGIKPVKTTKTNESGLFGFMGLSEGLYLINIEDVERGLNIYRSSPSLIFVPTYDATTQTYNHDVSVNIKTELVKKEDTSNSGGSKVKLPNTYDSIVIYIVGFAISLILLIILIIFILYNKNNKKGENLDGKKDK